MTSTTDFEAAARAFIDMVGEVRPAQWENPALGSWNVRSLVGHTGRAITLVEQYLGGEPAAAMTVPDAETYYAVAIGTFTDNDAIAARGVEAGLALNEDSGEEYVRALDRTLGLIEQNGPDRLVAIGTMGGIPLGEYLRTRVFELVVHGMDIARAAEVSHGIPEHVVANTADLAARVAVRAGHGTDLLFALTGRGTLPPRFSIL